MPDTVPEARDENARLHQPDVQNPFHDKPEVGLADILIELQSIRDMQDSRAADILEAVRALKRAPTVSAISATEVDAWQTVEQLRRKLECVRVQSEARGDNLRRAQDENERLRAHADKVEIARDEYKRAHQVVSDDCELRAQEYAALSTEARRLQERFADQALTIATLQRELAETKHMLSEERALTAATVGKVTT